MTGDSKHVHVAHRLATRGAWLTQAGILNRGIFWKSNTGNYRTVHVSAARLTKSKETLVRTSQQKSEIGLTQIKCCRIGSVAGSSEEQEIKGRRPHKVYTIPSFSKRSKHDFRNLIQNIETFSWECLERAQVVGRPEALVLA